MNVPARKFGLSSSVLFAAFILMAQVPDISLPQDKGPDKIEAKTLPPEIRHAYRLTLEKCSLCHTAARVLNTTMPASYWASYVGTMMKKSAGAITSEEAETISKFLVFDQANRKDAKPEAFYRPLTEDEIQQLIQKAGKKS